MKSVSMSPAQSAYALALAYHDTLKAQVEAKFSPLYRDDMTEEEDLALYNRQLDYETECGLWEARNTLREAEENLIAWAKETISVHPLYPQYGPTLEPLWSRYCFHLDIRRKLVNLCFRLPATA